MNFKKIEVLKLDDNNFTVIVDDRFADNLCIDEALGVVASALFASSPLFVRTYEQKYAQWKRLNLWGEPSGILEDSRPKTTNGVPVILADDSPIP